MLHLLEVLITFVGVILVMALAAQSIQEVIKVMFAIKGQTSLKAVRGLIVESARSRGLPEATGTTIFLQVVERLRALGQYGVRPGSIRLDALSKEDLKNLIQKATHCEVDAIKALGDDVARQHLKDIGDQAYEWYDLAMSPVGERYRRRMRGFALVSSALIVLGLNADAIGIFRQASTNPEFRAAVLATAESLNDREKVRRQLSDSIDTAREAAGTITVSLPASIQGQDTAAGSAADSTADTATAGHEEEVPAENPTDTTRIRAWAASLDSIKAATNADIDSIMGGDGGFLVGDPGEWRWKSGEWWIGIGISILLVSLGAPFWHDLLEALFGLKNRIRAQAENAALVTKPEVEKRI